MRAPHRLVLTALGAAATGLALVGLGDGAARSGVAAALPDRAVAVVEARTATDSRARGVEPPAAPSPARERSTAVVVDAASGFARTHPVAPIESRETTPHPDDDHDGWSAGGSAPGPRVALEPLVPTPGRVSAPLRGDDPGAPRPLVLWRILDGRAARAADGASLDDGSLTFPQVLLSGRGELFVTGAAVPADVAVRLPGDRIPVPAPLAVEASEATIQRSAEQEAAR